MKVVMIIYRIQNKTKHTLHSLYKTKYCTFYNIYRSCNISVGLRLLLCSSKLYLLFHATESLPGVKAFLHTQIIFVLRNIPDEITSSVPKLNEGTVFKNSKYINTHGHQRAQMNLSPALRPLKRIPEFGR